jgi:AraC-like DNA-binding protein
MDQLMLSIIEKNGKIVVPTSFITGQATRKYQLSVTRELGLIGIVFKPSALYHLLGIPMYEFNDERISLADILSKEVKTVQQQIMEANDLSHRIAILEQFLIGLLKKTRRIQDRIDDVAMLIHQRHGLLSTHELRKELCIGERQFQRLFLNKVGVSAKYFARICRMSHLSARMAAMKWEIDDWNDLVYDYGYFDQSHFIKTFIEFMGTTPSGYIRSNQELAKYVDHSKVRRG